MCHFESKHTIFFPLCCRHRERVEVYIVHTFVQVPHKTDNMIKEKKYEKKTTKLKKKKYASFMLPSHTVRVQNITSYGRVHTKKNWKICGLNFFLYVCVSMRFCICEHEFYSCFGILSSSIIYFSYNNTGCELLCVWFFSMFRIVVSLFNAET